MRRQVRITGTKESAAQKICIHSDVQYCHAFGAFSFEWREYR